MDSPLLFGEWLRQRRDGLGLTRKEFAKRVGCSVVMLRKIESGERRPSGQIAELMANALDIPPAEHSTFVRVARGDLNVQRLIPPSNLIPLPNISSPKTNLPILPTPLIGRQHEVDEISQLLHDPQCRLLTIVGPGGIGKTRLAIEIASQMQEAFADGVYFIPLAPVNSIRYIVPVIADAVGFSFQSSIPADPRTQLFNFLKEKQILFLTDNLEHLLTEPGIELLAELLANAPQIKLLATSRESLGLQGEWIFEVHGLPVPENGHTEDTSIELFVQRARRAHMGLNAIPEDLPAILRVCRLVEGMPLAIELAAAWVRTLTCDEIAREIERGLDLLSASTRDLPARHRSMRAVFDHSWKLLTEEEGQVLARLSIFRGGFQREAAEQVAGASLQVLSSLVIRSLLQHSSTGRYELHDLLRKYALAKLDISPVELENTKDIHSIFFLDFFGEREGDLRNGRQIIALAEIKAEFENIRVAWQHAVIHGQVARLRKPTLGFWFYDICAWFQEAYSLFRWTLEEWESKNEPGGKGDPETIVTLEHIRANLAYICIKLGKFDEARRLLNQSLPILRSYSPCTELLNALHHMGALERLSGNLGLSQELFLEMLDVATRLEARWHLALAHGNVGLAKLALGEYQEAYNWINTTITILREEGERRLMGAILQFFGEALRKLGKYAEAQDCLNESLEISKIIGDRWVRGLSLNQLGLVFKAKGEYEEAARLFRESLAQLREINEFWGTLQALKNLGSVYLSEGNYPEARSAFCELLSFSGHEQILPEALDALIGLAHILMEEGSLEKALALVLLAADHPLLQLESKAHAEQICIELKSYLTSQQVKAAHVWKNEITLQEVVSEVILTGRILIQLDSAIP